MTIMTDWIDAMQDYGFEDLEESTLIRLLREAHHELVLREPWPFRLYEIPLTQAANDPYVLLGDSPVIIAMINTTDDIVMVPLRTDTLLKDNAYDLTLTGKPRNYYFKNNKLYIWPIPDGSTELVISRLLRPAPNTLVSNTAADSEVLWPAVHSAIVLYSALSKAYLINDDPQSAVMQQIAEQKLQVARSDLWMQQYDRTDRVVILDDDDYIY